MSAISLFEEKQVTEQILRLLRSIPFPKAEPFKRWLAKVGYERLEEIENPKLTSRSVGILPTFKRITPIASLMKIAHDRAYPRLPRKISKLPKPEATSPATPAANSNLKVARKSPPNQTSNPLPSPKTS